MQIPQQIPSPKPNRQECIGNCVNQFTWTEDRRKDETRRGQIH